MDLPCAYRGLGAGGCKATMELLQPLSPVEILQVEKMGDALVPFPNSVAHLSPSSAFFLVLFYSGLAGYIRIPAKYVLTQDYDLCAGFSTLIC